MLHSTLSRLQRPISTVSRRTYVSVPTGSNSTAHRLAEEAIAQKAGNATKPLFSKGKKLSKVNVDRNKGKKKLAIGTGVVVGTGLGCLFYYGRPFEDDRDSKYVAENPLVAAYHRSVDRFHMFEEKMSKPIRDKLLPDPLPAPYQRTHTLVINMDETLVYSTWDKKHGWRHAKRPGVDYFLPYIAQMYEIVVFTSQPSMNAEPILEKLDQNKAIMYRLYRDSTHYVDGKHYKDLSHLNRDLSKVIIMDSNPEAFSLQPENGIALKPWKGDPKDTGLLEYIPFLEDIAIGDVQDVRPLLKSYEGKDIPKERARLEAEFQKKRKLEWEKKKSSRNLGNLLSKSNHEGEGPPPTMLDQIRKQSRETFAHEFAAQKEAVEMDYEQQKNMLKEMKMPVWELMMQASSVSTMKCHL
ncbi:HAD-like domain-containing protein [Pilobolus umbonatus]|nr:HAD-like domain-containing protein [Pilobolus umbonatus]